MSISTSEIFQCSIGSKRLQPLFLSRIYAGFPSPADDYLDKKLDLNEYLISHPAATFFIRVQGDSMINAGIHSGDILIVDRSLEAKSNNIIIAVLNGEFTVKRFQRRGERMSLHPANPTYPVVEITSAMDFHIWGVVVHVIHSV